MTSTFYLLALFAGLFLVLGSCLLLVVIGSVTFKCCSGMTFNDALAETLLSL